MQINKPLTTILSFLTFVLGAIILCGWICEISVLTQVNQGVIVSDVASAVNFILCGLSIFALATPSHRFQRISQIVCGGYIIITSSIAFIQNLINLSPSYNEQLTKIFISSPFVSPLPSAINVSVNWILIGILIIMTGFVRKKGPYMCMQFLGFISLLTAIIGFVSYSNQFDLLFGWYQYLVMPFYVSIGMIMVCVSFMGTWVQNEDYQNFYEGQEDRKILIFSGFFMLMVAFTAGIIGFSLNAVQNEKFLKSSFAQSLNVKSSIFKESIQTAVNEADDFVKMPNVIEFFESHPAVAAQTKDEIHKILSSALFQSWRFINTNGQTIETHGHFKEDQGAALTLKGLENTVLIWEKGWNLQIQKDVVSKGKKIGTILFEKPMSLLDQILVNDQDLGISEEKNLCVQSSSKEYRCFSSSSQGQNMGLLPYESIPLDNPIYKALNNQKGLMLYDKPNQKKAIVAYEHIAKLGVGLILKIDINEIYENIYKQINLAFPMVVWFIIFSLVLLSWQVIPLVRKMIFSEKDAIENARLLTENEFRLRAIINNIGEAILILDEENNIESLNTKACEIFKCTELEILGRNIFSFFEFTLNSSAFNEDPEIQSFTNLRETIAIRPDGQKFPCEFYISQVRVRHKRFQIAIIRDITDRKRVELLIRESENRFRSSFDFAPIGMALVSVDGRWLQVNQALSNIVGYAESELIGTDFYIITEPDDMDYSRFTLEPVFNNCLKTATLEKRYLHKTGREIWVHLSVFMMNDEEGNPLYIIAQIQDITERKQVESKLKTANDQLTKRFGELELHTKESNRLSEMSRILQSCLTVEEAYSPIETFCRQLMPSVSGALYFTHSINHFMEPVATWGDLFQKDHIFPSQDCWALRSGQIHQVDDLHSHIYCPHTFSIRDKIACHLCIPMMAQGENIGLLYLEFHKNNQGEDEKSALISDSTRVLAATLADQIALALSNIRLRETLQHQSIHDGLTGLYNRRYMEEFMRLEFLKAGRRRENIALIMLDVDHFKRFNDTYGHETGDYVLQEISSILQKNVRESDIACRIGGEEFVVLLPEATLNVSVERAQAIRLAISQVKLFHGGQDLGQLTASLGVALFPQHGSAPSTLLEAADQALYKAKKLGRNRVVVYGQDSSA